MPLIQWDLLVVPLTQRYFFLQSLTSVPPHLECIGVFVPPILQDLSAVPLTQQFFLTEFDQCTSSPCMHGGVCLPSNRTLVYIVPHTQLFLAEFGQCASSPCMHGGVCASHLTEPVCILYLSLNNSFLQSLTSVPPPLVCTEVYVPLIQQDLCVTVQEQGTEADTVTPVSN